MAASTDSAWAGLFAISAGVAFVVAAHPGEEPAPKGEEERWCERPRGGRRPGRSGGSASVRLEIVGTRGEVVQERLRRPGLAILAAGAPGWVFESPAEEPFGPSVPQPLDHLIDCLESGRDPVASIQEARRSFFVALAAYDSAWKQRPVTLSW